MPRILHNTKECINSLANKLNQGDLVAFPTDTVYGIGANALNKDSICKLYKIKNRPLSKPLILLSHSIKQIEDNFLVNDIFFTIANQFFPGAITLILNRKEDSKIHKISAYGSQQGVRIPNREDCLQLLKKSDVPIVSSSANISSTITSTTSQHVMDSFKNQDLDILDSKTPLIGLESTIINIADENDIHLVRHGSIDVTKIEKLGIKVNKRKISNSSIDKYKLKTPIQLNSCIVKPGEGLLAFGEINFFVPNDIKIFNLSSKGSLKEASKNLFSMLLQLDNMKLSKINIMPIPNNSLGETINKRLIKLYDRKN